MAGEQKLTFADRQHLIQLLVDGICERRTARELLAIARAFLEQIDQTLSNTTYNDYLKQAKEIFNMPYKECRVKNKSNALKRLSALAKRTRDAMDYSTALKIEKEITLLKGVYKDLEEGDKEQTINIVFTDATKED